MSLIRALVLVLLLVLTGAVVVAVAFGQPPPPETTTPSVPAPAAQPPAAQPPDAIYRRDLNPYVCWAIELDRLDPVDPDNPEGNVMARLDMQGRWLVYSWDKIGWAAINSEHLLTQCIAKELMARRATLPSPLHSDLSCRWLNAAHVQQLFAADPIMQQCDRAGVQPP